MNTVLKTILISLCVFRIAAAAEQGSFEEQAGRYKWFTVPEAGLPNVLILGDSISIGYTLGVRENLAGAANVYRPVVQSGAKKGTPVNCLDTAVAVRNLSQWLATADRWDVIHCNWGLHDLRRSNPLNPEGSPDMPNNVELERYEQNLQEIADILKQSGAKIIFALTTPVPDGAVPCRLPDDVARYNEVAIKVMTRNGIEINDLYSIAKDRLAEIQMPENVHFTPAGNQFLAEAVAEKIRSALNIN